MALVAVCRKIFDFIRELILALVAGRKIFDFSKEL